MCGKMRTCLDAFSQRTLSNTFSWMSLCEFWLRSYQTLFFEVEFGNNLALVQVLWPVRRQAIFWTNYGSVKWRIYSSLGLNVLNGIWSWNCPSYAFSLKVNFVNAVDYNSFCNVHGKHYNDVIISTMASQITSLTIVYATVYSSATISWYIQLKQCLDISMVDAIPIADNSDKCKFYVWNWLEFVSLEGHMKI